MTTNKDNTTAAGPVLAVFSATRLSSHHHVARDAGASIDIVLCDDELLKVPLGSLVDAARACGSGAHVLVLSRNDARGGIAVARHIMEKRPGGARLDLVVSDLCMPGRDGLSVLNALRELEDEVPVIVMSAVSGDELQRCEDAGAYAVLEKPFDLDELCQLARDVASWRHA